MSFYALSTCDRCKKKGILEKTIVENFRSIKSRVRLQHRVQQKLVQPQVQRMGESNNLEHRLDYHSLMISMISDVIF